MKRAPRLAWFINGLAAGLLIVAAVNACSYFVWSGGWKNLVAENMQSHEAIGFPKLVWRAGTSFAGNFVDRSAIWFNFATGILFGSLIGTIAVWQVKWLDRFEQFLQQREQRTSAGRLQFSVRGLLVVTTLAAIIAAGLRMAIGNRPELLLAVYLFGPLILILLAMIPRGISWQQRVLILIPCTCMLIVATVLFGMRIGLTFDRVAMAFFICWVPQTVFAAVAVTVFLAIKFQIEGRSAG